MGFFLKKKPDGQLSLFYLLIVSVARLAIFQARFLYFAAYFSQNTIGFCTHCILVIAGKQGHKEEFGWWENLSGSIFHLKGLGQTWDILVTGISLSPKYAIVRGMHAICRNHLLKTIKRAIVCIKTISNQLHTSVMYIDKAEKHSSVSN